MHFKSELVHSVCQNKYQDDLYLCYTGWESCKSCYTFGPSIRQFYLIHYIVSGKGTYTTRGQTFHLKKNDAFMIYPNEIATYSADKDDAWEYCYFAFNGPKAYSLLQQTNFRHENLVTIINDLSIVNIIEDATIKLQNSYFSGIYGHGVLLILLNIFMEAFKSEKKNMSVADEYVIYAKNYIDYNYSSDLSVKKLADLVSLNRSHFYRIFKSVTGVSPSDYILKCRVDNACRLLEKTNLSLNQISTAVGFRDYPNFYQRFKKIVHETPSEYRIRCRNALLTTQPSQLPPEKITANENVGSDQNESFKNITGRVIYNSPDLISVEIHDPHLVSNLQCIPFIYDSNCIFSRRQYATNQKGKNKPPQINDKVNLTINSNGYITRADSYYGNDSGIVISFTPPSIKDESRSNGVIQLQNGNCFELTYGHNSTKLNTVKASGKTIENSLSTIANCISVDDYINVDYCTTTYNGSVKRALSITQGFYENYEDDLWQSRTYNIDNLSVGPLDTVIAKKCLFPVTNGTSGSITYHFVRPASLTQGIIQFAGRCIIDTNNHVTFKISYDNTNWKQLYNFTTSLEDIKNFEAIRIFDISKYISGRKQFYLKIDMYSTYESWASINILVINVN